MNKRIFSLLFVLFLLFSSVSCASPEDPLGDYTLSDHITLGQYLGISYKPAEREVNETDIENALKELQEKYKTPQSITDRAAQKGDEVTVSYSAAVNETTVTKENIEATLVLGASETDEKADRYIDGFEEAILGLKVSESKTVNLTFPTDFYLTAYAGLKCDFTIKVTKITVYNYPQLTDAFIAEKTEYKTIDEYTAALKKDLAETKEKNAVSEDLNTVWNQVLNNATFSVPEERVEDYFEEEMNATKEYAEKSDMTVAELLATLYQASEADYEKYIREVCVRRVKEEFAFYAIAEKENLLLTPEEFDEKAAELATHYGKDVKAFLEDWGEEYIRITLQGQKVMEYVLAKAVPQNEK